MAEAAKDTEAEGAPWRYLTPEENAVYDVRNNALTEIAKSMHEGGTTAMSGVIGWDKLGLRLEYELRLVSDKDITG